MTSIEWLASFDTLTAPAPRLRALTSQLPSDASALVEIADRLGIIAGRDGTSVQDRFQAALPAVFDLWTDIAARLDTTAKGNKCADLLHVASVPESARRVVRLQTGHDNMGLTPPLVLLFLDPAVLPADHPVRDRFKGWSMPKTDTKHPFVILGVQSSRAWFHLPTSRQMTEGEVRRQADVARREREHAASSVPQSWTRPPTTEERIAALEQQLAAK